MAGRVDKKMKAAVRLQWHDKIIVTKAAEFYGILHLWRYMLDFCGWTTLVKVSHLDRENKVIIRQMMTRRVERFLGHFVPQDYQVKLWEAMKVNRALIVGGLVRCIMSRDMPVYDAIFPPQLDIVVSPETCKHVWVDLFRKMGYVCSRTTERREEMSVGIRWYYDLHQGHPSRTVRIIVARELNLVPALLMAPLSSQLFVLSHANLYCFYPKLFARQEFVYIRDDCPYIRRYAFDWFNFGLVWIPPEEHEEQQDCGDGCPVVWRTLDSRIGGGIGQFEWGGLGAKHVGEEGKADALLDHNVVDWSWRGSIGDLCRNTLCPNYGRMSRLNQPAWETD